MDEDLKFRYQQHDGRNTAIVAVLGIAAVPLIAFIGLPFVYVTAGLTVGFLISRMFK